MKIINDVIVFGDVQENALEQITNCRSECDQALLMADHHLGYSIPVGGVVAKGSEIDPYKD